MVNDKDIVNEFAFENLLIYKTIYTYFQNSSYINYVLEY